jgi:hypothetical protein
MTPSLIITHERLGIWSRQLKTRLATDGSIRWTETRSRNDLALALTRSIAPIVVIDLGDRHQTMLDDLAFAATEVPLGLFLVFDHKNLPGMSQLAHELGATHVFSGFTPPPRVADLLNRWLPLAQRRSSCDGWCPPNAPEPEPWERDDLFESMTEAIKASQTTSDV